MIRNKIVHKYFSAIYENNIKPHDTLRGKGTRIEILASYLQSACIENNKIFAEKTYDQIISNLRHDNGFNEFFYGLDDEDIGAYGTVPTSFAALAISEYINTFPSKKNNVDERLYILMGVTDCLYEKEQKGFVIKATLNRSKALNTDLLAAQALASARRHLTSSSIRSSMYDQMIRRVIFNTIKLQFADGSFPYQRHTFRIPFLYHIMVTSQLKTLYKEYPDPLLGRAIKKAIAFIDRRILKKGGLINWDNANDHDKRGAIWAYGFLLGCYDENTTTQIEVSTLLSQIQENGQFPTTLDNKSEQDLFYSAWLINALVTNRNEPITHKSCSPVKVCLLKYYRLNASISAIILYLAQKINNYVFNTGSHENTNPNN